MYSNDNYTIGMSYGISNILSFIMTINKSKPKLVNYTNAKIKLKNNIYQNIFDARSQYEVSKGCYPAAINMSHSYFIDNNILTQLDKNKKYLVYCNNGNRSRFAAYKMSSYGFTDVEYITSGYQTLLIVSIPNPNISAI